jgi:hypothetical protein
MEEEASDICWLNEPITIMENTTELVNGIQQGTTVCVTDRSYKTRYGTAALIILPQLEAPEGITLINQTPGSATEHDPYRAELGGIYGCIAYINHLAKLHSIMTGTITLACDCWSALLNVFFHEYDTPSQAQYDLVHACRLLIRDSPITWHAHHVRGHQDDHVTCNDLDRWDQLNGLIGNKLMTKNEPILASRRPPSGVFGAISTVSCPGPKLADSN